MAQREHNFLSGETFHRAATVASVDKEKRTVELSFSSEIEYERWPGVIEVLSHDAGAVDMERLQSGSAPLLENHDLDKQIGVVESAKIAGDRKGRAVVRFGNSKRASRVFADVADGIRKNVSVGYRIKEIKLTEQRDDTDVYTATRWGPYEISIVSVPADNSVGIGRSASQPAGKPVSKMANEPENKPTDAKTVNVDIIAERSAAANGERERVRTILAAGQKFKEPDLARDHAEQGKSVEEFQTALTDKLHARSQAMADSHRTIGLNDKELKRFSFIRLIRALASDATDKGAKEAAKFELEACEAAGGQIKHRQVKGLVIPNEVLTTPLDPELAKRSVVSVMTGTGFTGNVGQTVQTSLLASSFVDLLRNKTVIMQKATLLEGLVGNIDVPKQVKGSIGYWIGEDDNAPIDDVSFSQYQLSPHTCASYQEITRRSLMVSSLGLEALMRADIAKGLGQTIDLAGYYGTGSSNQPLGIKPTTGISEVVFAGANPTFAELVQMETNLGLDNIDDTSAAYVANASFRGYTKSTLKFNVNGATTIWEAGNKVNDKDALISNQVADGDVFFGDFSQLVIGMWGGLEILVDPFTHSIKGRLRIVSMQDVDLALRRPQAFCLGNHSGS